MRKSAVREMSFNQTGKRKEHFAVNGFRRINIGQKRHRAGNQQNKRIERAERQTRGRYAEQKMIFCGHKNSYQSTVSSYQFLLTVD